MTIRKSVCLMLAMLLWLPSAAGATSLWTDKGQAAALFADQKAGAVGDIVTIIISESSSATRSGQSNNSKSASTNSTMDASFVKWNVPVVSADHSDSHKTQGSISNSNSVAGRITATITAVRPNGNLVISGTQSIRQNNEEQKITVSGVVRPEDIRSDNTVYSNAIAEASIRIDGKGPISRKQRQGILTQLFGFLF